MSINIKYITRLVLRYKRNTNKSGCYHKTVDNNFGRSASNLSHVLVLAVRAEMATNVYKAISYTFRLR